MYEDWIMDESVATRADGLEVRKRVHVKQTGPDRHYVTIAFLGSQNRIQVHECKQLYETFVPGRAWDIARVERSMSMVKQPMFLFDTETEVAEIASVVDEIIAYRAVEPVSPPQVTRQEHDNARIASLERRVLDLEARISELEQKA